MFTTARNTGYLSRSIDITGSIRLIFRIGILYSNCSVSSPPSRASALVNETYLWERRMGDATKSVYCYC